MLLMEMCSNLFIHVYFLSSSFDCLFPLWIIKMADVYVEDVTKPLEETRNYETSIIITTQSRKINKRK